MTIKTSKINQSVPSIQIKTLTLPPSTGRT